MSSGEGHKSKLSLHSSNQEKFSEKINISILKCKNLKPQRPEGLTVYARIEFDEKLVSETPKVNIAPDGMSDFNFNASLTAITNDQNSLDELSYKPVILNLIEVLPKEKKQKEEKIQPLGQCTFDVLPIIRGETKVVLKLTMFPVAGSPFELLQQQQPEIPLPELEIAVSVDQQILSDEEFAKSNIVTVTVESLYSPPEPWNNVTQPYAYTAAFPMPVSDERDNAIVFVNGAYRAPLEAPNKQKRWGDTRGIQAPNGIYIANNVVSEDPVQEEAGDFHSREEREFRINAEKEKSKITWNIERRCFLNAQSSTSLREQVMKTRYWPVEVMRTSVPTGVKGKKSDEEFGLSYHGVAYVDMSALLYPGATRIRGAYKINPYNDVELVNKTKRKPGLTDETLKVLNYLFDRNLATSPINKSNAKSGVEKKDAGKKLELRVKKKEFLGDNDYSHDESNNNKLKNRSHNNVSSRPSSVSSTTAEAKKSTKKKGKKLIDEAEEEFENENDVNRLKTNIPKVVLHSASSSHTASFNDGKSKATKDANESERQDPNAESQQYLDSKSFIMIEIKLDKPIIPRKPFEVLAKRVSELIPPRPKFPLRNNSAEKAVTDYHSQVKGIVNLVLDDYRKMFAGDSTIFGSSGNLEKYETIDIKRRKLLFELNATGKYFAFKEQLKNSVVKIVREKFLKTNLLEDKDQMQQFLSELYVYLVDEMHKAINQVLSIEELQPIPNEIADSQQMKHFAIEAEMNQNYDLASHYYQERIAREKDSYQNWLDYAAFNFLIEDYRRAEECLKECISINQHEVTALLLNGVICTMQENFEIGEIFFDRVTCNDPENVIAWCLYAMFYEQTNQDQNADITFAKTIKLNQTIESLHEKEEDEQQKKDDEINDDSNNKTTDSHPKSRSSKRGSQFGKQIVPDKGYKAPKSPATGASVLVPPTIPSALGATKGSPRSPTRLDETLDKHADPSRKSIYMKTAKFLIDYNAFSWAEKCLAKELVNSRGGPSCEFYVLLSKIKLAKNQLEESEKNCCSALSYDYQSCEAWTLWGHVKYLSGEFLEAKQRYERVLQFPHLPTDQIHSIYIRLASIYLQEENFEDAKRLFLFACKNSASCMSWLGVGICCYRLSQLEDSEDALSEANILNNKAPEVWAYLSLICLKTNRPLEAEQAYKYAIKLNLDNQSLLDEIHALQEQVGFGNVEF